MRAGSTATLTAWKDETAGRELMAKKPAPGAVTSRREIPELGVTVLTLSNGVEVWLKPTDFRNDQVQFIGYARGGASLAAPAEFLNASLSTALVGVAGVGGFTPIDLGKVLAGRIANASPFIGNYTHGISGGSTPRDLEAALQLVYLYFTAPNRDPQAFDLMKSRMAANLANQAQNPGSVFGERLRSVATMDHYSVRPMHTEDVDRLNQEGMQAFYAERFRNAADFTFFFVGAFKVDEVVPLLDTYLATLPSTGKPVSKGRDMELKFPGMVLRETVRKGQEPRSQTAIMFFSDTGLDELDTHRLRAGASILQSRLRDVLREELGGTYSVGVVYSDTSPQPGYGTTTVQFGSSPDNAQRLTDVVMAEVEKLRRDGPTETEVERGQGNREAGARDVAAAERLLAQLAAGDAPARARSEGDPQAARSRRLAHDRQRSFGGPQVFPAGPLRRRHVDAGERAAAGGGALRICVIRFVPGWPCSRWSRLWRGFTHSRRPSPRSTRLRMWTSCRRGDRPRSAR